MTEEQRAWTRQGTAFWRAHHEAWKRSDLNQRQYCEAEGIPLEAFKFNAEPQPSERTLLYRPWPRRSSSKSALKSPPPESGDLSCHSA
jgi:hypothetical protein